LADLLGRAEQAFRTGRVDAAVALWRQALEDDPGCLAALKGLGRALLALRRLDASSEMWEAAFAAAPDDAETLFHLGMTRHRRGDHDGAIAFYDCALAAQPGLYGARGMRLLALLCDAAATPETLWTAQREWAEQRPAAASPPVFTNDPDPERPLRIGFLSSDFRAHSVGFNILPAYRRLDRTAFRLYSYAEVARPDAATRLFEEASDCWRATVGLSDSEVAATIRADRIDVLVVLAGHLDENRPFVARLRAAPVQIAHHDICTSAMPEMDYFLGDPVVTPRGGRERFSERVVRLPNFTVHAIPAEAPPVGPLPALSADAITFGSFNAPQKITPRCAASWAAVLRAVPGSRLLLKHFEAYGETATRARVLALFAAEGIADERISVIEAVARRSDHLAAYGQVDIALDPFPFNGATTTYEALLMGVPVVALAGERFVSRCAAATLKAVGLDACVAGDPADYVARAVELAADRPRLAAIRAGLRGAVARSRICDADGHARHLGRVYRAVWRRWCAEARR